MNAFRSLFKNKLVVNTVILVLIFITSVLIRLDNLKAPMGRHHEWLTGHVLTTLYIFENDGLAKHYFSPVWLYNNDADRHVVSKQVFTDKNHFTYYVSYPPFCFILPSLIFKVTGVTVSVTAIRVFGLINHFLCALLIFLILHKLFHKKMTEGFFIPAYIAYSLYLFSAGNLWFHMNVYFADMLVHLFVLSAVYIFIGILEEPEKSKGKKILLLFSFTFLGVYTEWIALFVAFFMGVVLFFKLFRSRNYFSYLTVLIAAPILAIGLTIFQYSQIAGFELLKEQSVNKYKSRSGYDKNAADGGLSIYNNNWKTRISEHYETNYNNLLDYAWLGLYIILLLIILNLFHKKTKVRGIPLIVLGIILLSILAHHIVFLNFTLVHDFSTLKASLFLTLFIAYVIALLSEYFEAKPKLYVNIAAILVSVYFIHLSIQKYYVVNKKDFGSLYQQVIGDTAVKYGKPDEIIFANGYNTPVVWWYAKRNVIPADNIAQCANFLKIAEYDKGLFIRVIEKDKKFIVDAVKVNRKGDTLRVN